MPDIERRYDIGAVIVAHRTAAHDRHAPWTKLSDAEYDAIAGTVLRTAASRAADRGAVELVGRARSAITEALNCPAHSWHGSDEARRWLMDAARLGGG